MQELHVIVTSFLYRNSELIFFFLVGVGIFWNRTNTHQTPFPFFPLKSENHLLVPNDERNVTPFSIKCKQS
jgi:hypothetical protein